MTALQTGVGEIAPRSSVPEPPTPGSRHSRGTERVAWAMLAPNLLLLGTFLLLPLGWAFALSFQVKRSFGEGTWAGLQNYTRLLSDDVFWRAALNTVVFTAATVPVSVAAGLGLALLLDRAMPARALFRTIVYLPVVVSTVVVALIGVLMFDESIGLVNGVLADLGLGPVAWQSDGALAMTSVVLMTLWTRVGFALLIYLAALQDVDREMLEAAEMDGAGPWQRVRHMIIPTLRPATVFLVVVTMIWSFQIFDVVYVMTNGGPGFATTMVVTYAYDQGFGPARNFGYGSTVGIVVLVLTAAAAGAQLLLNRRRES